MNSLNQPGRAYAMTGMLFRSGAAWLVALILLQFGSFQSQAAVQFAGLWQTGSGSNIVDVGLDSFLLNARLTSRHTNGLRMVRVHSYDYGPFRYWSGIWRSGSDAEYLYYDQTFDQLATLYSQLFASNLRLVDIDTYANGNTRYWAGLWRSGTDGEVFYAGFSESQLIGTNNLLLASNLRLIDVETYVDAGTRYWAALWRSGTDASVLATSLTPAALATADANHRRQGLSMIDVKSYTDSLGAQRWAAVWRATGATTKDLTMDDEKLSAEVTTQTDAGQRMFNLTTYDVDCAASCQDNVVANIGYNYGITRTATHCNEPPGTCTAPPPNSSVYYRWPVVVDPNGNYVRLSAVNTPNQFLTLPFADPLVKHRGIWLYSPGSWHHAADYSRDDVASFRVRAAAPGKVIHVGWDVWSGNTIIISHDIGGQTDNYRTIYMHLRNGADNDCANAWNLTIPWFNTTTDITDKTNYIALLNATGCTQNPRARNPDPAYWGLNSDTIRVSVGQPVGRGHFLAWAGETGPGGNRDKSHVNTHLHIFFAHRDPTDNNWYFFDPYGIYSTPECYPVGVDDPLTADCVRYPIAWQGASPAYPPPVLDWEKVSLGIFLGPYLKLSWEDPAARLQSSSAAAGVWTDVSAANSPYYAPYSTAKTFFQLRK